MSRHPHALTLRNRRTSSGSGTTSTTAKVILQGFEYAGTFDTATFLKYGLNGTSSTITTEGRLRLPARRLALEVG